MECEYCDDDGVIEMDNNGPIVPCPFCGGTKSLPIKDYRWHVLESFYREHPEYSTKAAYEKLLAERYPPLPKDESELPQNRRE
jgi:hypothetical protein